MKISKKIILIFGLLLAVISVPSALLFTGSIGNAKSVAYKRASKKFEKALVDFGF